MNNNMQAQQWRSSNNVLHYINATTATDEKTLLILHKIKSLMWTCGGSFGVSENISGLTVANDCKNRPQTSSQQSGMHMPWHACTNAHTSVCMHRQTTKKTKMAPAVLSIKWQSGIAVCSESENVKSFPSHTGLQSSAGARLTKYLTTILR